MKVSPRPQQQQQQSLQVRSQTIGLSLPFCPSLLHRLCRVIGPERCHCPIHVTNQIQLPTLAVGVEKGDMKSLLHRI